MRLGVPWFAWLGVHLAIGICFAEMFNGMQQVAHASEHLTTRPAGKHLAPQTQAISVDPKAGKILASMSHLLTRAKTLQVDVRQGLYLTAVGSRSELEWNYTVALERPRKLALILEQPVPLGGTVVTDGRVMHVYYPDEPKRYMRTAAPASLEGLRGQLVFADRFFDLLLRNPDRYLLGHARQIEYVGRETLARTDAHHIRIMTSHYAEHIWIRDGDTPVPLQLEILPLAPATQGDKSSREIVVFSAWRLDAGLPEGAFEFVPPSDAEPGQ